MQAYRHFAAVAAACALVACGGSPNTPNGPVVGSGGGPLPPPPAIVKAQLKVTLPRSGGHPAARLPKYLSPKMQSLSIGLASVNGGSASGAQITVLNTNPNAPGCKRSGSAIVCTASIDASPGNDVFDVTTYRWPNATGDVLATGTVAAHIGGGYGVVDLNAATSRSLGGVIAKLSLRLGTSAAVRGTATTVAVQLEAFDASGALIGGDAAYASPIALAVEGDSVGAFTLHEGGISGATISVLRPPAHLTLTYDGNRQAPSSIAIAASVSQPNAVSANASFKVSGSPPPLPVGSIYVLDAGHNGGLGASVDVFAGSAKGNAAPKRTLQLSGSLYARSIAVDADGNLYVGYLDNVQGFSPVAGTPDGGNEIAVYPPNASGKATPSAMISADPSTSTAIFPIALAFDSAGDLVTFGATAVDGNTGDAVLSYAPNSSGAVAPAHAWSFASPQIRYAGPTGLALDTANNGYVNGQLHTPLGPSAGLFVNAAADAGNPASAPSRTVPWDARTQLTPGEVSNLAVDRSGELYIGNFTLQRSASATTCQAQINVYSAGAASGTTDVAPLRVLALGGVAASDPNCYSPSNPLAGYYPFVASYGSTIFVADEFGKAVDTFAASAKGTVLPATQIAGSATGLSVPIGVFITPPSGKPPAVAGPTTTMVRFVEGAPLLQTKVAGTPVGLGTGFLQVDGKTVESIFDYGTITPFAQYTAGVQTLYVIDSLGYRVGPFETSPLAAGKSYTIVLTGSYPKYSLLTFEESAPSSGATLALYEAAPHLRRTDFGRFDAATGSGFKKLGSAAFGTRVEIPVGKSVANFGAYAGTGTTPMAGGQITLQSVDSFDRRNVLPFHNATRLSLLLLDPSPSGGGPLFPILDGANPSAQTVAPATMATPSPPPGHLYVDHNGTLYQYRLPLSSSSRPQRVLAEDPGSAFPPQIAVDAFGNVAIATATELRLFKPPIVTLDAKAARTIVQLTPAMTQIGPSGADLVDIEFDPRGNLWLFSGLGGEITELQKPIMKRSVASVVIPFGAPGTKTASYGVVQGRFDVNSTLYIYGASATSGLLFKTSFPYSRPPSPLNGLNVAQASFVDTSQYLPTDPDPSPVILGQYFGSLASPPPQQPPPQPVNVLAQFALPLNPVLGIFPNATVDEVIGAIAADPPANLFFALDAANGRLSAYPLPMPQLSKAAPKVTIRCLGGVRNCNGKPEHLFLAP